MTIAELIQTLRTYPSDAVVYVFDRGDDNAYPLIEVTPRRARTQRRSVSGL